jgi:hypothetical protein
VHELWALLSAVWDCAETVGRFPIQRVVLWKKCERHEMRSAAALKPRSPKRAFRLKTDGSLPPSNHRKLIHLPEQQHVSRLARRTNETQCALLIAFRMLLSPKNPKGLWPVVLYVDTHDKNSCWIVTLVSWAGVVFHFKWVLAHFW